MTEQPSQAPGAAHIAWRAWRDRFGSARQDAPELVSWAPGRINVIGEHTDYNEGWALPAAVDRVLAVAGTPTSEPVTTLYSAHHGKFTRFASSVEALREPLRRKAPLWARIARATLAELAAAGHWRGGGLSATIAGDVPVGAGLSSSAALEVAFATFALGCVKDSMEPLALARLCQRAEQRGARVRVGVMDQAASCLGRAGQAILLDCRSLEYAYTPAAPPDTAWLVFDTGAPHILASSGYNQRRAQCESAARRLAALVAANEPQRTVTALRDVNADDLQRYGASLDRVSLMRARHVVEENARTLAAAEMLRAGDARTLGALLDQSHVSLRDLYEVSCAELDIAVDIARSTPGAFGARMMGAGFGGSILVLTQASAVQSVERRLAEEYPPRAGREGHLIPVHIGGGPETAREGA